jgi:WD40 repeat protein
MIEQKFTRLLGGCLAAALLVVAVVGTAPAAPQRPWLLVVAYAPPSYQTVAHAYDNTGRLIATVRASNGTSISWSPDGSLLALSDSSGVLVERRDGSGKRQLLKAKTICTTVCLSAPTAVWSPDGKTLAVGGGDPKTSGFVRIDVVSGHVSQLGIARPGARYIPIAFSPDGKLLAYATDKNNANEALFVSRADGTRQRLLHQFQDHHDGPGVATWSPDSGHIAFTEDGRAAEDPRFGIVDVATARIHAFAPHQVGDQSPAWSPDGSRLALAQFRGPAFTVAADGSGFRPLPIMGTIALWLRNGDILLTRGASNHSLAIVTAAHGPARTLLTLPYREQFGLLKEAR